jgi:hypothetical protein
MRFKIGQPVYLKTGNDKGERIITRISVFPGGKQYELSYGTETSWHYACELIVEKPKEKPIKGLGK